MAGKKKAIDTWIFDFCYENALRDATLRSAFTGELQDIRNMKKLKDKVRGFVDDIFNNAIPIPDSAKALEDITKLEELVDYNENKTGSEQFRFGNTQKLLNMTTKYIYISVFKSKDLKTVKRFSKCHCPIDSKILGKVVEIAEGLDNNIIEKWNKRMREKGIKRNNIITMAKNISFSSIKKTEYDLLQEIIIDMVTYDSDVNNAIEFDYKYW